MGMDAHELNTLLESINAGDDASVDTSRQGMGVRNVHERIRLYFGPRYGLRVSSIQGTGTRITCVLPRGSEEQG